MKLLPIAIRGSVVEIARMVGISDKVEREGAEHVSGPAVKVQTSKGPMKLKSKAWAAVLRHLELQGEGRLLKPSDLVETWTRVRKFADPQARAELGRERRGELMPLRKDHG